MTIILHLGAHRTGTTTFQSLLDRNRADLARRGLAVWTPARTRGGLLDGLVQRPCDATPQDDWRAKRSCGRIRMERARLAGQGQERLLLSEENLLGAIRNNLRERCLFPDAADAFRHCANVHGRRVDEVG